MRRCLPRLLAVGAVAGSVLLAGCSSGGESTPTTSSTQPAPSTTEARSAPPGAVEVSPGGVTTAVGAPAESTEEEYFQACNAARMWMTGRGGDIKAQLEPYLADVQRSDAPGPGTFDSPWSKLTPGRQAAVIVAAEAAADERCG